MKNLKFDGFDVVTSHLSKVFYRAAFCDILLEITPENFETAIAKYKAEGGTGGKFSGLCLKEIEDLSFLKELPLLLYLEIHSSKKIDSQNLKNLENLRGLHLNAPTNGIDFECFPHLEQYSGKWNKNDKNIARCFQLRRINIDSYNEKDFSYFKGLSNLESLTIIRTTIENLDGIETLEDLKYLELSYCSKLNSIDEIKNCNLSLREIEIQNAKKISSYLPLSELKFLKYLIISNSAPMENLNWIKTLNKLYHFSFVETNVIDGNLKQLLELPNIRHIGTYDKRHYNLKSDEIWEHLQRIKSQ